MSSSIYEPLDPDGGIRILVLEPAQDEAQISCRLISHNINRNPNYKALSYEWGSQRDLRAINLNGQEFHVGENLWWALWYLRKDGVVTRLWVDALCINQKDENERGHQVSMMGKIYRNVDVICWLGKGDELKHVKAMEYICDWSSMLMRCRAKYQKVSSEGTTAKNHQTSNNDSSSSKDSAAVASLPTDDTLAASFDPAPRARIQRKAGATSMARDEYPDSKEIPHFADIEVLCSHSYWRRTWIIQEFVLGKSVKIRLGPSEVNGEYFQYAALRVLLEGLNDGGIQMLDAFRIFNLRGDRLKGHHLPLVSLIELSEKSSCQDLRDRIYAMIGLASDCQHGEIAPDYSKPLSSVYEDVVLRHFYPSDRDRFGHSWSTVHASYLVQQVLWKTSESLSEAAGAPLNQHESDTSLLNVHGKSCGTVIELMAPQGGMWWAHPGLVKRISSSSTSNELDQVEGGHAEVDRVAGGLFSILTWPWTSWFSSILRAQARSLERADAPIMRAEIGGSWDCFVPRDTQVGD